MSGGLLRRAGGQGALTVMLASLGAWGPLDAQALERVAVEFTHTADVGFGNEVLVLGAHPLLGGGDPGEARKLVWSEGDVWRGAVALPAGESLAYSFIVKPSDRDGWCDPEAVEELAGPFEITVPGTPPAPDEGKTIKLLSTWEAAHLYWRHAGTEESWTSDEMTEIDAGRSEGERLFRITDVSSAGAEIEFVFHNADQSQWLNAQSPPMNTPQGNAPGIPYVYQGMAPPFNFRTALDGIWVQDRQVFNYRPDATPSAPSFDSQTVASTQPDIAERTVRVWLPRGYEEHTDRSYPVVYFHDGQNVFFPGGAFGTWDADRIAGHEIGQGRLREAILVAVDNTPQRLREYTPPGDEPPMSEGQTALGEAYAAYLIEDVKPWVDAHYRTLPGREETLVIGSSMGGLITSWIALEHADVFGTAGIVSPSYWAAPNHRDEWSDAGLLPVRLFLSIGSQEGGESSPIWQQAMTAANERIAAGHVHNADLFFSPSCGGMHNEEAFSRQMARFLPFALDPRVEGNAFADEDVELAGTNWTLY